MDFIRINNISNFDGKNIKMKGWVYNSRSSGKIGFLMFRDGSEIIQCIVEKNKIGSINFDNFKGLNQEESIQISGLVVKNERAPGGFEVNINEIIKIGVSIDYPISPKDHGTDFLMRNRHLWIRSKKQHAILKIRHEIVKSIRDFFDSNDFTLVDTPIFTPSAAEGTSTLFSTDYFGSKAYLAQTGQLYGEASAMAFGRHYNFGPTFRAEKSKTRRHLTEFWMVEPEIAFCGIEENILWAEKLILYIIKQVLLNKSKELNTLDRDLEPLTKIKSPFPRLS